MTEADLKASIDNLASKLDVYSKCMSDVHVTMFGVDGQGGCLKRQIEASKTFTDFQEKDYRPFKTHVTITLVAIGVGSGGTGIGIGLAIGKALGLGG